MSDLEERHEHEQIEEAERERALQRQRAGGARGNATDMRGNLAKRMGPAAYQAALQKRWAEKQGADSGKGEASEAEAAHEAARHGTSGMSGSLPHLEQIQKSFGRHDVTGVRAYTDANAQAGAKAMGAEAFATGDRVAFAGAASLHTAAHEAAHVVQQRAGVQLKGGVGEAGDAYEQHADAVADRVMQGQSAESLLDEGDPRTTTADASLGSVQRMVTTQAATRNAEPAKSITARAEQDTKATTQVDVLQWPSVLSNPATKPEIKQTLCNQIAANRAATKAKVRAAPNGGYYYPGKDVVVAHGQAEPEKTEGASQDKTVPPRGEAPDQRVRRIIAKELTKEGGYSSINSYDDQKFTWGRGLSAKGKLPRVMEKLFGDPTLQNAFLKYGILYEKHAFHIVNTTTQEIICDEPALDMLKNDPKLLDAFVQLAEDTKGGRESSAQKIADAQWSILEHSDAFNPPAFVRAWDDKLIAFAAHLVHWLGKVKWKWFEGQNEIKGVLGAWLEHIDTVRHITQKRTDKKLGPVIVASDSAGKNLMKFGDGVASKLVEAHRQGKQYVFPIPVVDWLAIFLPMASSSANRVFNPFLGSENLALRMNDSEEPTKK